MAFYSPVPHSFWAETEGWSDAQQKLALYLLTSPHRSMEGLYNLSIGYAAEDMGWSEAKTKRTMKEVAATGFVEYDWSARVVLLPKALEHYQPRTKNQIKGALAWLLKVRDTPLKKRFVAVAHEYGAEKLLHALSHGHEHGHSEGVGDESA